MIGELDGYILGTLRWLETEQVTGQSIITHLLTQSMLLIDVVVINVGKLPHVTFEHAILVILYFATWVVIPNIGYNHTHLRTEQSRKIGEELLIEATLGRLEMPLHVITLDIYDKITIRSTTYTQVASPPSSTGCADVVLKEMRVDHNVLEEMSMTAKEVYLVILQKLCHFLGALEIARIIILIPACGVHVQEDGRSLWHITQILLQPRQLCISHRLQIFLVYYKIDILHRDD